MKEIGECFSVNIQDDLTDTKLIKLLEDTIEKDATIRIIYENIFNVEEGAMSLKNLRKECPSD